jgi:hypothetical protein
MGRIRTCTREKHQDSNRGRRVLLSKFLHSDIGVFITSGNRCFLQRTLLVRNVFCAGLPSVSLLHDQCISNKIDHVEGHSFVILLQRRRVFYSC